MPRERWKTICTLRAGVFLRIFLISFRLNEADGARWRWREECLMISEPRNLINWDVLVSDRRPGFVVSRRTRVDLQVGIARLKNGNLSRLGPH